jgi:hypothetical protein
VAPKCDNAERKGYHAHHLWCVDLPLNPGRVVFLKRSLRSLAVGNFPWKFLVTS